MMKFVARLVPAVVILLLATSPLLVSAQGGTDPLCGGLSESDCQLLMGTLANLQNVTSFTTPSWEISANLTASGIDENGAPSTQSFELFARGTGGGFSFDPSGELLVHLNIEEASLVTPDESQSGAMEIILTKDMMYVNYNGKWYGGEVSEEYLDSLGVGDLSGMTEGMGTEVPSLDLAQYGIDLTNAVSTTRLADDDAGAAVFSTAVSIPQLLIAVLSSPQVGEMMGAMMGSEMGDESMTLTPEDLQMLTMFIDPLLAGTLLTLELHINPDDQTVTMVIVTLVINVDASLLMPELGKLTGDVNFMSEASNVNQPLEVTFPEDFLPIEELQPQLDALGLSM